MSEDSKAHKSHEECQILKEREKELSEETRKLELHTEELSSQIEALEDDISFIDSALDDSGTEAKHAVDIASLTNKRKRQDVEVSPGKKSHDNDQHILSIADAKKYRDELAAKRKELTNCRQVARRETKPRLTVDLAETWKKIKDFDEHYKSQCIKHRNDYAKPTI